MYDLNALSRFVCNQSKCIFYLDGRYVMYTVLSSLAACGCLGVAAAAAGVFVCHA